MKMKLLRVSKTNNSVLKAFEHEVKHEDEDVVEPGDNEVLEPGDFETRCVGSRKLRTELNDATSEACDWRITPHA